MTKSTDKKLAAAAAFYTEANDFDRGAEHVDRAGKTVAVSVRLPERQLGILKEFARREGTGYQTLMKRWLDDRIRDELAEIDQSPDAVRAIRKNLEGAMRQIRRLEVEQKPAGKKKAAR